MASLYTALTFLVSLLSAVTAQLNVTAQLHITGGVIYECHFEDAESCNFKVTPYASGFTWTRYQGSTPSDPTGPDYDHTFLNATGHYMYTEATDFNPGDVARLQLPALTFQMTSSVCLTFWFNMYGQHIGTLNVTNINLLTQQSNVVWSLSHNQSYGWFQGYATIRGLPGSTNQISFIGERGGDDIGQPFGDIAIDDVIVYNGSCGDDPTTAPTLMSTTMSTTAMTTTATTSTTKTTTIRTTTTPTIAFSSTITTPTSTITTPTSTITAHTSTITTPTSKITTPTSTITTHTSTITTPTSTITTPKSTITTPTSTTSTSTIITAITSDVTTQTNATSVTTPITPTTTPTISDITTDNMLLVNMTSDVTIGPPDGLNANSTNTPTMEGQAGSEGSQSQGIWSLSSRDLIIILACLSAAVFLLIVLVAILACCLCITRRRYYVAKAANGYQSESSTVDRVSTIENHPRNPRNVQTGVYEVNPY